MNETGSKFLSEIVSGGQTGVDRAALDVALSLHIPHGGWCPKGRRAEDGPIALKYLLKETDEEKYEVRTEKNVVDSDGTLIFSKGLLTGGTLLTLEMARMHHRPFIIIDLAEDQSQRKSIDRLMAWISENRIRRMNVAGPRESTVAGIYNEVRDFLSKALG